MIIVDTIKKRKSFSDYQIGTYSVPGWQNPLCASRTYTWLFFFKSFVLNPDSPNIHDQIPFYLFKKLFYAKLPISKKAIKERPTLLFFIRIHWCYLPVESRSYFRMHTWCVSQLSTRLVLFVYFCVRIVRSCIVCVFWNIIKYTKTFKIRRIIVYIGLMLLHY